jgi:hypothetical protein
LCVPQIEHLYGLTVFENYLYATNSDEGNLNPKTSVIRVNRFNSSDFQVVTRVDRGAALHVYHQRRQPQGTKPLTSTVGRMHGYYALMFEEKSETDFLRSRPKGFIPKNT